MMILKVAWKGLKVRSQNNMSLNPSPIISPSMWQMALSFESHFPHLEGIGDGDGHVWFSCRPSNFVEGSNDLFGNTTYSVPTYHEVFHYSTRLPDQRTQAVLHLLEWAQAKHVVLSLEGLSGCVPHFMSMGKWKYGLAHHRALFTRVSPKLTWEIWISIWGNVISKV